MYKEIEEPRGISSDSEDVSWSQRVYHKFRREGLFVSAVKIYVNKQNLEIMISNYDLLTCWLLIWFLS